MAKTDIITFPHKDGVLITKAHRTKRRPGTPRWNVCECGGKLSIKIEYIQTGWLADKHIAVALCKECYQATVFEYLVEDGDGS